MVCDILIMQSLSSVCTLEASIYHTTAKGNARSFATVSMATVQNRQYLLFPGPAITSPRKQIPHSKHLGLHHKEKYSLTPTLTQ